MKGNNTIPEFAIVGHPNEGKSSVVSTLSEDDSVRISPTPGETIECRPFPVKIDGEEIIRFIDTPGFQNPKRTLAWLGRHKADDNNLIKAFCRTHKGNPHFKGECDLLSPIARGAGIIYVVDGSRPIRIADRAEMEILRLTGRPRMAIINCKERDDRYLDDWKGEFRKHFNSIRVFNAHKATYAERINLLESLKSIDQDWQSPLERVISAFKQDWERRNVRTAEILCELLADCLGFYVTKSYTANSDSDSVKKKLQDKYKNEIERIEKRAYQKIKKLFKHNIFNPDLPPQSILNEDLFDKKTWQVLGLNPKQLAGAALVTGSTIGAVFDAAAAGLTFGVFTVVGAVIGTGSALFGGKHVAKTKISGLKLGGSLMKVGPNENIQFLYVLLDRGLIYYSYVINWAHGRRGYPELEKKTGWDKTSKIGFTTNWNESSKKVCNVFYKAIHRNDEFRKEQSKKELIELIKGYLDQISERHP